MPTVRAHARRGTRGVRQHRRRDLRVKLESYSTTDNGPTNFWVMVDGALVGHAKILEWNQKEPMLVDLEIQQSEQRQGYGTEAVLQAEDRERARGFKELLIHNPTLAGQRLYYKLGYRTEDGRRPSPYRNPQTMRKRL